MTGPRQGPRPTRRSRGHSPIVAVLVAVTLAGCSPSASDSAPPSAPSGMPPTTAVPTAAPEPTPRVDGAYVSPPGATVLVDSAGYPLYIFASDQRQRVTCTRACAEHWPPLKLPAGAQPAAGPGVNPALLASVNNPDGGRIITYNGWPLYTNSTDLKLGLGSAIAAGQGLDIDGGYWYLIRTDGNPIIHRLPPKP
jgi:predicted lipoprotein with Yx(FWY)xxD motif